MMEHDVNMHATCENFAKVFTVRERLQIQRMCLHVWMHRDL